MKGTLHFLIVCDLLNASHCSYVCLTIASACAMSVHCHRSRLHRPRPPAGLHGRGPCKFAHTSVHVFVLAPPEVPREEGPQEVGQLCRSVPRAGTLRTGTVRPLAPQWGASAFHSLTVPPPCKTGILRRSAGWYR